MNNQPPQGLTPFEREREREQQLEEHANRQRALHHQEQVAQREREYNERQERDRQERDQYGQAAPHQNNTGTIPIHQPVASRLPGAIHSPGGLLAAHGGIQPSNPLGAPSGPGNAFGGPLHRDGNPAIQPNAQQPPSQLQQQHQGLGPSIFSHGATPSVPLGVAGGSGPGFGGLLQQQQQQQQAQQQQQEAANRLSQVSYGAPQPHQIPGGPALGQGGQQPILNVSLRL